MAKARANGKKSKLRKSAERGRELGEFERIDRIRKLFSQVSHPLTRVGIGDDAAVLRPCRGEMVWTIDSSVENVHFRFGWLRAEDVGWRSFHAAASDLAAMGAVPVGALSALELPKGFPEAELRRILMGQTDASRSLGCPIIGGNLAAASAVSVTTTLLGEAERPLLRSGARVGDEVWLIGDVGLAAAGLVCVADRSRSRRGRSIERCVAAWRRPRALIERGRALVGKANAVIDVSDGLVGDAVHIAEASGVAIEFDLPTLTEALDPDLHRTAERFVRSAIDFALYGGEDYALLATGPRRLRPRWARSIGAVVPGKGVWGRNEDSTRLPLKRGFDHFRATTP